MSNRLNWQPQGHDDDESPELPPQTPRLIENFLHVYHQSEKGEGHPASKQTFHCSTVVYASKHYDDHPQDVAVIADPFDKPYDAAINIAAVLVHLGADEIMVSFPARAITAKKLRAMGTDAGGFTMDSIPDFMSKKGMACQWTDGNIAVMAAHTEDAQDWDLTAWTDITDPDSDQLPGIWRAWRLGKNPPGKIPNAFAGVADSALAILERRSEVSDAIGRGSLPIVLPQQS